MLLIFVCFLLENAVADLEHRFSTERDTFPPLCIATSFDQNHMGNLWASASKPNNNVLFRVTLLARHALDIIENALLSTKPFIKPGQLFIAPNNGYDLVIQLKPDLVSNSWAHEFGSSFTVRSRPNWRLPLADSNFLQSTIEKLRVCTYIQIHNTYWVHTYTFEGVYFVVVVVSDNLKFYNFTTPEFHKLLLLLYYYTKVIIL